MIDSGGAKDTCVQVALRIRPQGNREKLEGSRVCTSVLPNDPQVTIGGDRSFTYDHVFDQPTPQHVVYESCVEQLVDGLFDGFNATVLAYGQTGSGKTHTMGTAFDTAVIQDEQDLGVIPRAIYHTFRKIVDLKAQALEKGILEPSFDVSVQFVELYNDDVLDLLSDDRNSSANIRIHEDNRGEIVLHGVEQRSVSDLDGTMEILKNGALNRTVASTNMNEQSSRSHAIFTLHLKQQRVVPSLMEDIVEGKTGELEMEMLTAKFHFVDLAGSERMKRTGATGERAREGISINVGLLALGNVIAALGGANGKVSHVPYRDSKLTRLLQDSLGGNSRTLMIACCSPSDSDFVETLNTMKYANRAKEIKNKVSANQDKSSKMIGELRGKIASLEAELLEFKQGRRTVDVDGHEVVNDQYHENIYLTSEVNHLRFRVKALNETLDILRSENIELKSQKELATISNGDDDTVQATFKKYLEELERTKSLLYESQSTCDQLRKDNTKWKSQGNKVSEFNSAKLIELAKQEVETKRKALAESGTSDYSSMGTGGAEDDGTSNDADEIEDDEADDEQDDEEEEAMNQQAEALQIDLHDVMIELDIKEKLIDQLERAERQNQQIRETYEKKLRELMSRIKDTETERDKVLLAGDGKKGGSKLSDDQMKKIKQEYELKITELRKELKKIEALDKEHLKVIAKSQRELQEKSRLKSEVVDLKKAKVELIKKMNEDKKKQKQQQQANARAMATKEKQTRLQANKIRNLEMKDKQREQFLKKTTSEVNQLRKEKAQAASAARLATRNTGGARGAVGPVGGRVAVAGRRGGTPALKEMSFSPKQAKIKWNVLERKIDECVRKRQTIRIMEAELERYLKERHEVMVEIVENEKIFTKCQDIIYRDGILEIIDSAKQKLQYVQDQITYQQKLIMDVDQQGDEQQDEDDEMAMKMNKYTVETILEGCDTLTEAKYLMQHLFDLCLEKAASAAKVEAEYKESNARIEQLEQRNGVGLVVGEKSGNDDDDGRTSAMQRSVSPTVVEEAQSIHNYKIRRHTATQEELLYPTDQMSISDPPPSEQDPSGEEPSKNKKKIRHSRIAPVKDGMRGSVVSRTHTLEGHAKGVLSVDVSGENMMITGSKDRTAKLWDIEAGREIRTLGVHPNNVHLVKFVPFSNLVFTFSMFEGRAWDYRTPECICVKVINSSGQVNDGSSIDVTSVMPRQNSIPFLESVITAADVDPTGQMLFTSFSAFVRVWNLREWKPLGRLNAASHSPKSEVSCLKTTMTPEGSILAYTGSRDHYVKEYEVGTGVGIIESKCEFTPPHYDNVTAVLPLNGNLYTASKDLNIMKFSLNDGKREHLELRAHQQYIQSLVALGPQKGKEHLVSACKDGTVRFWDVSNKMRLVEEYTKAHSDSINDMSTKNNMLFTASSDSTVGFWKLN